MGRLVGLVLLCLLNIVVMQGMKCPEYKDPENGALVCFQLGPYDKRCKALCNDGYTFEGPVANYYLCWFGRWRPQCPADSSCPSTLPWPDCEPISGSTDDNK